MLLSVALPTSLVATALGVGWALSAAPWRGPVRPHFDGRRFQNALPVLRDVRAVLREGWKGTPWPRRIDDPAQLPPPAQPPNSGLRVTWIGHATALVQAPGLTLLTDPVWSVAAGPTGRLGPRRVRPAGIPLEALPPIDVVLLSHNHYDHLDVPTLRALAVRHQPRIYTPLGNAAFLARAGVPGARDLDWWETANDPSGAAITATEVRHFSGRGLFDRDRTLWCGFHVRAPGGDVYFAGDTGFGPHFAETRRRLGAPRLALLPIGAYLPRAIMQPVHLDPDEAVEAHLALGAASSVAIHWGSFRLTAEGVDDPPRRLAVALGRAGIDPGAFRVLEHGEGWELGAAGAPERTEHRAVE